ncbi:hypothetical protein BpHYR1_016898 [Brachionus plicatilis]|uniref:Uncharacterized protein n=1 Tax=Brachionus plicatilis TaxID=10195 RepID=A0A3M7RGX6_BRAPC|nr:hypothetical protein BpHYR1_016898 [Brachionus plicatilis]
MLSSQIFLFKFQQEWTKFSKFLTISFEMKCLARDKLCSSTSGISSIKAALFAESSPPTIANIMIPQTLINEQHMDSPGPQICNLLYLGDFAILEFFKSRLIKL